MKMRMRLAVLTAALIPTWAAAQSAFDGTWKVDLNSAKFPEKPDVYVLKDGTYQCKSCVPPFEVKADGQDHSVTGHPYYDSVSVKVIDDHTLEETTKKNGKTVSTSKRLVSPDGNTMTFEFSDSSVTNADPVTGKGETTRVAKGPEGSSPISGSWRTTRLDTLSDNGLSFTYKVTGDTLQMNNPTGQNYTAKLDGTEAPYHGDPGTTSVSVKKKGPNVVEEIDKRDAKVIGVSVMTVSADGKTMTILYEDKLHGARSEFKATRQ
jgi:hypothetical protein